MKSTCELNKRVCEHDKAVASGFARTDVTVQVLVAAADTAVIAPPAATGAGSLLCSPPFACLSDCWQLSQKVIG